MNINGKVKKQCKVCYFFNEQKISFNIFLLLFEKNDFENEEILVNNLIYLAPVSGIIAVIFAFIKATQIGAQQCRK